MQFCTAISRWPSPCSPSQHLRGWRRESFSSRRVMQVSSHQIHDLINWDCSSHWSYFSFKYKPDIDDLDDFGLMVSPECTEWILPCWACISGNYSLTFRRLSGRDFYHETPKGLLKSWLGCSGRVRKDVRKLVNWKKTILPWSCNFWLRSPGSLNSLETRFWLVLWKFQFDALTKLKLL